MSNAWLSNAWGVAEVHNLIAQVGLRRLVIGYERGDLFATAASYTDLDMLGQTKIGPASNEAELRALCEECLRNWLMTQLESGPLTAGSVQQAPAPAAPPGQPSADEEAPFDEEDAALAGMRPKQSPPAPAPSALVMRFQALAWGEGFHVGVRTVLSGSLISPIHAARGTPLARALDEAMAKNPYGAVK